MTVGKGGGNMHFIQPLNRHKSLPIAACIPAQPFNNLDHLGLGGNSSSSYMMGNGKLDHLGLGGNSSTSVSNLDHLGLGPGANMMGNGNVGNENDYSNEDTLQWLNNLLTEEDTQMQQ